MSINKFINEIEINELKKNKTFNKVLFEQVGKFIIENNGLLYGGYALNLILPDKNKFYKDYTPDDYDCYHYDALNLSLKLAKLLKSLKYKYIKVKRALHDNTYKIYVGIINVLDITFIDKNIFDVLHKIHKYEKYNGLLKYYNNKFSIVPLYLLKRNMHYELSRPEGSYFRWEKINERLNLLNKIYFTKENNNIRTNCIFKNSNYISIDKNLLKCRNEILKYIKKNKNPIIDSYGLNFYDKKKKNCCLISKNVYLLIILSININNDLINIKKNINKILDKKIYKLIIIKKTNNSSSIDILKTRYRIQIENKINSNRINLLTIIEVKDNCYSIDNINGYTVGSIDTILAFYYSFYLTYIVAKYLDYSHNTVLEDIHYYINLYENILKKIKTKNRFKYKCYGTQKTKKDIYESLWIKKLTLLKLN